VSGDGATPRVLPDVAFERPATGGALDWVGMGGIAVPVAVDDTPMVPARVDVEVDLADPASRGIHMSRLFRLLDRELAGRALVPSALESLLGEAVAGQEGLSTRARLSISLEHFATRPALVSPEAGWRAYPLRITAEGAPGRARLAMSLDVLYSSTCPASTALSRQAIAADLAARVAAGADADALVAWIEAGGLAATPHAQRSTARLSVEIPAGSARFEPAALIDLAERALGTPVQTLVRRVDEQAFARLNASNLMFCEDAARRLAGVLAAFGRWPAWHVRVQHHESLHAHDAVAEASCGWQAVEEQPAGRARDGSQRESITASD
jgi:GTP cyclohydrolase I